MSTGIAVSAFYDVDFCSNQNRRNLSHSGPRSVLPSPSDQRAVGTPITGANRNRNILERSMSEPADRNANALAMQQQQQQNRNNVNSSRYKTELCRPFEENGYCKYGDKCQFAHGQHELRSLARHPKYKTELCRTFHTIGFCPYGPRCHFIHNEDERKLGQMEEMKQEGRHQGQQLSGPGGPPPGRLSPPQPSAPSSRPAGRHFPLSLPIVRDSLGSAADSPTSSVTDSPIMSPTFDNDMLSTSFSSSNSGVSSHSFPAHPPMSAPPTTNAQNPFRSAFSFHDLNGSQQQPSTLLSPLNIHTDPTIASLTADLQAYVSLSNQRNNNLNLLNSLHQQQSKAGGVFGLASLAGLTSLSHHNNHIHHEDTSGLYAPPSPPDSLSGDSSSSSSSSSSMSTSSMCGSPLEVSRGLRLPIFTSLSHE